jgi:hypothetical protein
LKFFSALCSSDSLGAPLTLAGARQLAADIHRQRAMGRDIVADMKAANQCRAAIRENAANTFAAAAMEFVEHHAKTRRCRTSARMLLRAAAGCSSVSPSAIK